MSIKEPRPSPDVPRRFKLHRYQILGLAVIFLIPVLAFLNVFGDTIAFTNMRTAFTEVEIEYPAKHKFKQLNYLRVKVKNLSSEFRDTINVSMDTAYLSRFSSLNILPHPSQAHIVTLTNLRPNEKREVIVELEGHDYGLHRGLIEVSSKRDTLRDSISTYIFW